jgi:hypothetical protein
MNKLWILVAVIISSCSVNKKLEKKLELAEKCCASKIEPRVVIETTIDTFENYVFIECDSLNNPVKVDSSQYKVNVDSSETSKPKVKKLSCNCVDKVTEKRIYRDDPWTIYQYDLKLDSLEGLLNDERVARMETTEQANKNINKSNKWVWTWFIVSCVLFAFNVLQIFINKKK